MQIDGLTQEETVAAQFGALSRLGDERTYAQDLLYDKVRREHLSNVHMEALETLYKSLSNSLGRNNSKPFREHTKKIMRDKAISFMSTVYGVEL